MKGCMSTDLGIITIDPEVIAKYAGTVAVECFGIVGMAAVNMKDGSGPSVKERKPDKRNPGRTYLTITILVLTSILLLHMA